MLYEHLGSPETDFDAEIACQVASVRMAGFDINMDKLYEGIVESQAEVDTAELNVDSPKQVKEYILEALDEMEAFIVEDGCSKKRLDFFINRYTIEEKEPCCKDPECKRCDGVGSIGPGETPVVRRCKHIINIRNHRKRLQLYRKLEKSKAAFPSFKVIGTKSGRMSGADGLNWHGVDTSQTIREIMSLTEPDGPDSEKGWVVSGGDFDSQELSVMAATMNDEALAKDIETGRSLHAVFAEAASGIPYDQIMKKKSEDGPESVWYGKAKSCVYALSYGASANKIAEVIGCTQDEAEEIILKFFEKYVHMLQTRKQITESLSCLIRTDEGRLEIRRPKQTYVDSCFNYRRAFNVEYAVIGALVESMAELAKIGRDKDSPFFGLFKQSVIRKEEKGEQTIGGSISSAFYGATFSVQNKIIRAALNHQIQSAGRTITLRCQLNVWGLQPVGIHAFRLKIMSVHDELVVTSAPELCEAIADAMEEEINELCKKIPLLGLEWNSDVGSWYGVKATKGGRGMGFSRNAVGAK